MFSRLLLLTGALLYTFQTLAQAYEPGLLVRSNGDTLRGEIENGFWVEPPPFVRFRSAPSSPSQRFEPRQLRAVSFNGGRYFRYKILPLDLAAETRLDHLPRGLYAHIETDSLLAEVLVEGPATLLRVALPGGIHYVLRTPDQPQLELSKRRYLRLANNGVWAVAKGNNYKNQPAIYFSKCPTAGTAAQSVDFTADGLAAVVQAYNQACSPTRQPGRSWVQQAVPRRRVSFQGGLLAGMRYNSIESPSAPSLGHCVDCQVYPLAGLYAELLQPSRTSAVYGELSLSTYQGQNNLYLGHTATGIPLYSSFDYRAWLGTARLGIRYFFSLPHEQQWLLGFGFELNKSMKPTFTDPAAAVYQQAEKDLAFPAPVLLPNFGLGWRSRRITLAIDGQLYQENGQNSFFSNILGTNFVLRTGFSYRLGRNPDQAKMRLASQP